MIVNFKTKWIPTYNSIDFADSDDAIVFDLNYTRNISNLSVLILDFKQPFYLWGSEEVINCGIYSVVSSNLD